MEISRVGEDGVGRVLGAPHLFDDPLDPVAVRGYLANPRNVFLLAEERGTVVGFLRATALDQLSTRRPQMFLYEVAVDEAFRRRGVGAALVRGLLDHCRSHGFDEVFVFTDDPANVAAHRLYRSTGAVTETVGDRMYVYRL